MEFLKIITRVITRMKAIRGYNIIRESIYFVKKYLYEIKIK